MLQSEIRLVTEGTQPSVFLYTFNARSTEVVATTANEVGLTEDQQADRTFRLRIRRALNQLTVISSVISLWDRKSKSEIVAQTTGLATK